LTYHEVDFPTICTRKLNTVKATPILRKVLPNSTVETGGSWRVKLPEASNEYWCHGLDLRTFASEQAADISGTQPADTAPTPGAGLPGLRTDVPTLLISECCLCYLQTAEAAAVLKWFSDRIPDLSLVIYEPVRPDDAFGKTMVTNLASRGIVMPTLEIYKDAGDQAARLITAGFEHAKTMTVDEIWDKWVSMDEKDRVNGLEGLDEVEEWKLLAGHYIVAWGWRGKGADEWKTL
jgi:[phosphatase 2A protein]-leucine-carboxy methyltransferase